MKRGILFINGSLGLEVLEFTLSKSDISVFAIVLNSQSKRSSSYRTKVEEILNTHGQTVSIFETNENIWSDTEFVTILRDVDFGVSALYGHIIPTKFLTVHGIWILNLHPSLLPLGKGADPIPWAIIDDLPQGVTIHEIDCDLDTGPILEQMALETNASMSAGEVYQEAMSRLLALYMKLLQPWLNHELKVVCQIGAGSHHYSKDLENVRVSLQKEPIEYEKMLRTINALTFNDGRRPRVRFADGSMWEIELTMHKVDGGSLETSD